MTRTIVIGIDGATFRLIDRYRDSLPTLSKYLNDGYAADLLSTRPDITSVAWPSFATGQNPGQTGLFDFLHRDPETLTFSLNDVREREFDFFWEYLDGETGVASVPMVPYRSPEGFFIQGSLARVNANRITNARAIADILGDAYDYHVDVSAQTGDIKSNLLNRVASREQVYCRLVEEYDLECYFMMFSAVDFAQHHFWAFTHEDHALYQPSDHGDFLRTLYKRVDSALGEILGRLPEETNVVIVSDHGFTERHTTVNLNAFLRKEGLLSFVGSAESRATDLLYSAKSLVKRTPLRHLVPESVKQNVKDQLPSQTELDEVIEWSDTIAYSFGAGGNVYINLEGREATGTVLESAYEAVRSRVANALRELTDPQTGESVVADITPREEVYEGPYFDQAPDLVLQSAPGYYLTAKHGTSVFERQSEPMPNSGVHERAGILLADGPGFQPGGRGTHDIYDVAPTLVHLHEHAVPDSMDGKVIKPMVASDRPVKWDAIQKPEFRRVRSRVFMLRQLGRI
jgi:predicted AlkP superfamily phosphohydrolase/phosphomutase